MNRYLFSIILLFISIASISLPATAQEAPKTLFPYCTVPDTIVSLENRSNYFVAHFWDNLNLSKPISDKEALFNAFDDYITFFKYAHRNVVRSSVNQLMNNAQVNMKNYWLLAEAAEKYLYSSEATLKSDEAYILFIQNILKSSKVKKNEKKPYQDQLVKINSNQAGAIAPDLTFTDVNGKKMRISEIQSDSVANIVLFFTPDNCSDCSIPRLRLSTNVDLNQYIKDGEVIFINISNVPYSKEWAEKAKGYSDTWIIGTTPEVNNYYDIPADRHSIYLLDGNKIITNKNLNSDILLRAVNQ